MKTTLIYLLVCSACFAQSPTPSPTPFDSLGIYAAPAPSATPRPLTSAQIASVQAAFPASAHAELQSDRAAILAVYKRALAKFASDNILTAAQKTAALSTASQVEVATVAWALYNVLTYGSHLDAQGNVIPPPPIAAPSPTP